MALNESTNEHPRTTPTSHNPYLVGLDGLRALAVIAVLLYHAGYDVAGGYLGVESFFVLSGFLITTLLFAEQSRNGRIMIREFWIRRARRLIPALLLTLAGTLLLTALLSPGELRPLAEDTLAALLYVMNWKLIIAQQAYFDAFSRPSLLQHLWSLAIEEQFYLLWPLACAAGLRLLRPAGFLVAVLAAAAGSSLLMAGLYEAGAETSRIYYGTDTRASALLIGAALAMIWTHNHRQTLNPRRDIVLEVAGVAALLLMLAAYVVLYEQHPLLYLGGFQIVTLATATVIAATTAPGARLLPAILEIPLLRWIGQRSYSLYLWHWPIFLLIPPEVVATQPRWSLDLLRIGLTVILAAASYRFIEQPVRSHGFSGAWNLLRKTSPRAALQSLLGAAYPGPLIAAVLVAVVAGFPLIQQAADAPLSQAASVEQPSTPVATPTVAPTGSSTQRAEIAAQRSADPTESAGAVRSPGPTESTGLTPTEPAATQRAAGTAVTTPPAPPTPTLPPSPTPLPSLDPAITAELQALLDAVVADGFIPGAVLTVSVPGYTPWSGASGMAEREPERAMTPDTPVRIASVSKMFTAVVALQLVAEGKLSLDAPIATWIPDRIPGGERITVRQLLQHTAGLYDYLEDRRLIGEMQRDPAYEWQPQDLVDYAADFPVRNTGRWDYSSTHYVVLGMLIEQVTGRPLAQEVRERIFDPLGMQQAAFLPQEPVPPAMAHGYSYEEDITMSSMSFAFATGNLAMTSSDLERFGRALFAGDLLQGATRDIMLGRFVSGRGQYDMPDLEYGLGVMRNRLPIGPAADGSQRSAGANLVLGHIGGYGGFRSALWYAPESGIVISVGFNQAQGDPNNLAAAVLDLVLSGIDR